MLKMAKSFHVCLFRSIYNITGLTGIFFCSDEDNIWRELEEIEAWIANVQRLLWAEPQRIIDSKGHVPSTVEVRDCSCT